MKYLLVWLIPTLVGWSILSLPGSPASENVAAAPAFLKQLTAQYGRLETYSYLGDYVEVAARGKLSRSVTLFAHQKPDRYRVEVLAGRGKGTVLTARGDQVVVRPSPRLPLLKLHYRIDDPQLSSYRGRGIREGNFLYYLRQMEPKSPEDLLALAAAKDDPRVKVLTLTRKDAEIRSLTVAADGLFFVKYEVRIKGETVEKEDFKDIQFGVNFPPETFAD